MAAPFNCFYRAYAVRLSNWGRHFFTRGAQDFQALAKLDAALVGGMADIVIEVLPTVA